MTGLEWRIHWNWDWPLWVSVLMTIAVVVWVAGLYFREACSASKPVRMGLVLLRLTVLALVVAMIAQPAIEWFRTGRPQLVVLVDRSASMDTLDAPSRDGKQSRLEASQSLLIKGNQSLLETWQSIYDLEVIAFDEKIVLLDIKEHSLIEGLQSRTTAAEEKAGTRLGDAVDYALREVPGIKPSAVVLFTDGISTRGQSLEKSALRARALRIPLYPVAVGSSRKPPDVAIENFLAEEVVFPGDRLQVEATLYATGYEGREATLTLSDTSADQVLAQTIVQLPAEGESQTVRLTTRPETPGELSLRLKIESLEEEVNVENNAVSHTVEVRDEKIQVLLVQASPSYEYRALKSLLQRDPAIQLQAHLQEADTDFAEIDDIAIAEFPNGEEGLSAFDVVLLGDVDPTLLPHQVWENLERFVSEHGGGLACIAGPRFMPNAFQEVRPMRVLLPFELEAASLLNVKSPSGTEYPIQPTKLGWQMSSLQLGETEAESRAIWRDLPAVTWLFEIRNTKPGAQVLAEDGSRNTRQGNRLPIILRHYVGRGEVLFHATDETWRWRWRTDDRYFARYWGQTVRRLGRSRLTANRQGVQLATDRSHYRPGEEVKLCLRFLNPASAPADKQGVVVQLQSDQEPESEIRLLRRSGHRGVFEAVVTRLLPGDYQATLLQPNPGETASSTKFKVELPIREFSRLVVDEQSLRKAADLSGGKYYTLETVSELTGDLPRPHQTTSEQFPARSLWNTHMAMALFVVVLTTEWLLRRRHGML